MRTLAGKENGFTLIEVVLAVLIIGIGVLSVFTLISGGLTSNARAIGDTQAALFADSVFGVLHAQSVQMSEIQQQENSEQYLLDPIDPPFSHEWGVWWNDFKNGGEPLFVAADAIWQGGGSMEIKSGSPAPIVTLAFTNRPFHSPGVTDIMDHTLRYQLTVEMAAPPTSWSNRVMVTLDVWEGAFGSSDPSDGLRFYSEFDTEGDL